MHCGAHKLIYGPPLDMKVREEKDNLQCDKGRDIRDNPEEANRGNCGVMGVNFEESLLKERVEKKLIKGCQTVRSPPVHRIDVILTENSSTVKP